MMKMVMKKDGRKRDIKSKLVAAVCMLLVSCIMMVSSTYAWFTLSTAPEVTGITTAVGANGNLEMALLPESGLTSDIGNANGSETDVNLTWGNLVDLSDAKYGLGKITLYPSKLLTTNNTLDSTALLGAPKYGSDGRFNGSFKNASAATYNGSVFSGTGYGVRGVGTSSGMSALETAYRTALSAGNTALQNAIAASKSAVSTGGSKLASMAVNKATGTTYFSAADKQALVDSYDAILVAVGHMETALKNYFIADILTESGLTDTTYAAILTTLEVSTLAELAERSGANATLATYVSKLNTLKGTVTTNRGELNSLAADDTGDNEGSYSWTKLSPYVTALADVDKMLLNGHNMTYWMEKNGDSFAHLGDLVSQMSNLVMEVNAGSNPDTGIFAQMADFVDTFTTDATISGIQYQGISADNLKVNMKVNATASPAYLPGAKSIANTFTASSNPFGEGGGSNLTDFYGYILDLAFRTNAADSYLQLQTDAIDRIYDDNESNPDTMGGGSTMIFTVPAGANFSSTKMINLMSYIRVVFFNPTDGTIHGYARLDSATADVEQETEGSDADGYTVTMQLRMWDVTLNPDDTGANPVGGWAADQKIVELVQNTATAVSSLVYLDGADISNEDVANVGFTGTMNLQFSSSADLVPMEYGDLRNGNTETADPATPAVTEVKVDTANSTQNYTYKATAATVGENQGISVVITDSNGAAVTTGTVTIAGVNATYSTETSSWIATYSGAIDSTTSVVVTVA